MSPWAHMILGLLCTVIKEFIATKLKLRARLLAGALEKLLDNEKLRENFYEHGVIVGAKKAVMTGSQSTLAATRNGAPAAINTVMAAFSRPSTRRLRFHRMRPNTLVDSHEAESIRVRGAVPPYQWRAVKS